MIMIARTSVNRQRSWPPEPKLGMRREKLGHKFDLSRNSVFVLRDALGTRRQEVVVTS